MQVYVVTSGEYSDYGINAIFSTVEKAQEYVSMKEFTNENEHYRINVWEVDKHYEEDTTHWWIIYYMTMVAECKKEIINIPLNYTYYNH